MPRSWHIYLSFSKLSFVVAKGASFDTSKVSFAMDGAAYDVDLNPTTARFNDAEVTRVAIPGDQIVFLFILFSFYLFFTKL